MSKAAHFWAGSSRAARLIWLAAGLVAQVVSRAETTLTDWVPIFKGIEHRVGTNTPSATSPHLQVMHALRVDLTDPDIVFFATPRFTNYIPRLQETAAYTVSDFLSRNKLQAAINANFFDPADNYATPGSAKYLSGLAISQGVQVSQNYTSSPDYTSVIMFTTNNEVTVIPTNLPPASVAGIYTAVTGEYSVLVHGVNVGFQYQNDRSHSGIHLVQPRTVYGVSEDKRYLYLVTIDGRQPGYSDGALDYESAQWMLLLGAYDAVNMDGGGSTTLVVEGSTGKPNRLNKPSTVADSGRERTVGSHFGIFAKPVPGFINDVKAVADDTTAIITWTTTGPGTSQVQYGISTNFTDVTAQQSDQVTNHTVQLTGLEPATTYYYAAISSTGTSEFTSPTFTFTTTNYVTTNVVVDLGAAWKYSTANLDGVNWTAKNYDDSGWTGSGPAVLWVDSRGGGASAGIPQPATQMAFNQATFFPYVTYYFRSHFNVAGSTAGGTLIFDAYVDDGAVFYLNGAEIYRLRMDPEAAIGNGSLAISFPCGGNADCPDEFEVKGDAAANLVTGDNVLAVEVHNYNAQSPDITFGTAVTVALPAKPDNNPVPLAITQSGNGVAISWTGTGLTLQQASAVSGPWADIPGAVTTSPYQTPATETARYYRLRK
ncbi:MAG TPA: phosphodiester glycosidase family protein [Verrucomicrobiae bacterium]|nr:phosphodiester glycosidase family protein [Verrucomicrobiae bacterium]